MGRRDGRVVAPHGGMWRRFMPLRHLVLNTVGCSAEVSVLCRQVAGAPRGARFFFPPLPSCARSCLALRSMREISKTRLVWALKTAPIGTSDEKGALKNLGSSFLQTLLNGSLCRSLI